MMFVFFYGNCYLWRYLDLKLFIRCVILKKLRFQYFQSIRCYIKKTILIACLLHQLMTWPIFCRNVSVSSRDTKLYSMNSKKNRTARKGNSTSKNNTKESLGQGMVDEKAQVGQYNNLLAELHKEFKGAIKITSESHPTCSKSMACTATHWHASSRIVTTSSRTVGA